MAVISYYNGSFMEPGSTPVPIEERGHQFGDGVYEVVRVYGGRPFLLDWHLERLENSLRTIEIENPFTKEGWTDLIGEAIRRSGDAESIVYWHVTRGIAPRNHTFPDAQAAVSLTVRPLPTPDHHLTDEEQNSLSVTDPEQPIFTGDSLPPLLTLPDERWVNAFVKSINLLPNVIAKELAHRFHAQEAMFVRGGRITECSGSNVWFVKDGELYTAPLNRFILPGITRRFVVQLAAEAGIRVHEKALAIADLDGIEEAFVTSTTQEIAVVGKIVVPVDKEAALYQLPDAAPHSLTSISDTTKTLWTATSAPVVAQQLKDMYTQYVQRIREGEVTLAFGD